MKKYLRIIALIILSSCGFEPIYKVGNNAQYDEILASIQVVEKKSRLSQVLRLNLTKSLNPNNLEQEKKYLLYTEIKQQVGSTFIKPSGSSGRNKVILTVKYRLLDISNNELVIKGLTNAQDDYDVEDRRFANYIAQEEISLNLTKIVAQNIRDLLIKDLIHKTNNIKD